MCGLISTILLTVEMVTVCYSGSGSGVASGGGGSPAVGIGPGAKDPVSSSWTRQGCSHLSRLKLLESFVFLWKSAV